MNLPQHTVFLDGYLDACGKLLSSQELRYSFRATILTDKINEADALGESAVKWKRTNELPKEALNDVTHLFEGCHEKVVWYLVEYINWFVEFSTSCEVYRGEFDSVTAPEQRFGYKLVVDGKLVIIRMFVDRVSI